MTVFRDARRNGRWSFNFKLNRKRYQGVCDNEDGTPARTKGQAQEAEARRRKEVRALQGMARSGLAPGGYLLAQAIDLHLESLVDASASHLKSVKRIAGELLQFFGVDRPIAAIPLPEVNAYRTFAVAQKRKVWVGGPRAPTPADHRNPKLWKVLARPRSASEVNHCLDVLRCAFKAAHKVRDPLTGHSTLPFPPDVAPVFDTNRVPTPMPEAELADRLAEAPPWTRETALLARLFGCRLTEAATVELRHMDRQERCLRFLGSETKSGRDEPLYGGDEGWRLLERLEAQARRRGTTRLITWPGPAWARRVARGEIPTDDARDPKTADSIWRPLKSIKTSWKGSARRAGVEQPHRYHDVRAAYITDIARGASGPLTRLLARHASMATTEKYIGLVDSDRKKAANQAARRRARMKVVK